MTKLISMIGYQRQPLVLILLTLVIQLISLINLVSGQSEIGGIDFNSTDPRINDDVSTISDDLSEKIKRKDVNISSSNVGTVDSIDLEDVPKVILPQGTIEGYTETVEKIKVKVFKGIPYADPPIEDLRFRPSRLISKVSNETYSANGYGPNCWEPLLGPLDDIRRSGGLMVRSEDCLYLNIWSPVGVKNETDLLPVIVYVHGGVLIMHSAADAMWTDGRSLAAIGNVIVVTLNYRLGTLGFLFSGDSEAPGNLGITDQLTALKWINKNIQAFGGDPSKVTLYGLSSGALTVSMLFLSGKTNGLISGLVADSGGPSVLWVDTKEEALNRLQAIAVKVGCYVRGSKMNTGQVVQCLRSKPALLLTTAAIDPETSLLTGNGGRGGAFFPTLESDLFPQSSLPELFSARQWSPSISILIWIVTDEGFAPATYGKFPKLTNPTVTGCAQQLTATRSILLPGKNNATFINDLIKTYCKGYEAAPSSAMLENYNTLLGDWYLVCPSYYFADILAADQRNPVYFGKFTYYNETVLKKYLSPDFTGGTYGARHGFDKLYMMGIPYTRPEDFTSADRGQSYQLISIYSRFAATGDPGWTSYQVLSSGRIIPFMREINSLKDIKFTSITQDRFKCDIWNDIFYN